MTITISGNRMKIEALPFADSSNAPPISIRYAGGKLSRISCSLGQIWLVTSGACTPSTTSPRTVIAMSRLRRQMIGSSWEYSIFAICVSGTATPLREVTVRSPTWPRSSRSDGDRARDHRDLLDAVAYGRHRRA